MDELTDAVLLERFAGRGDEGAFRTLVERHLRLVYSAAVRQLGGDRVLAQDVAQAVFALAAKKAKVLARHPTLAGWLVTTTRNCARDARRTQNRKWRNEKEVAAMQQMDAEAEERGLWRKIEPEIDELLAKLETAEREAVALRFFEERSYADVGRLLGINENAARMRVERALEKLRASLGRRGIGSTAALLGSALTTHGAITVPAQLAGQIAANAVSLAAASGSAGGLAITLSMMKSTQAVSVIAALAVSVAVWQGFRAGAAGREVRERKEAFAVVRAQVDTLREELERTRQRAKAADEDIERLLAAIETSQATGRQAEMPKLAAGRASRAEVEARFRQARELAKSGNDDAAAMKEFLWCFDEGMDYGFSFMVLRGELMEAMGELAKRHPPMREAMIERREQAERAFLADEGEMDRVTEFATLSVRLGEQHRLVEAMSKLPKGDNRRGTLMNYGGFDELLETRRYGEIVEEQSFAEMSQRFEMMKAAPSARMSTQHLEDYRKRLAENTAKNVEALAGAGKLDEARELAAKVIQYDDTPETRRVLAERLERAGWADLLTR